MRRKRLRRTVPAVLSLVVAACGGKPAPAPAAPQAVHKPVAEPKPKPPRATKASARPAPRKSAIDEAAVALLKSDMVIPVAGVGTMDLVDTFNDLRGSKRRHNAIDIMAPRGTAVVSATGGRVLQISSSKNGGLMVFATDESEKFLLLYAHLDSYAENLSVGRRLVPGQVIGTVGTTGNAPPNTPHLHFAVAWSPDSSRWSRGTPIDPRPLLIP